MANILVSGLINLETTLAVSEFPISYQPVRYPFHGIRNTVAGVGYNIGKALHTLGNTVQLTSIVGDDMAGAWVRKTMAEIPLADTLIRSDVAATAQAVIAYTPTGQRAIFTDLKDIQETAYPAAAIENALAACDLAILCNINFSRPFLRLARQLGKPIATDVHALADLDDAYNGDFLAGADIIFLSHERLSVTPQAFLTALMAKFATPKLAVVGMGAEGALMVRREGGNLHFDAVPSHLPRPIISTVGAGDALFSCFLDGYLQGYDPLTALRRATYFAGYKIGAVGAAEGFLSQAELAALLPKA
jgi:acarbose 7IV-phosphotransferase